MRKVDTFASAQTVLTTPTTLGNIAFWAMIALTVASPWFGSKARFVMAALASLIFAFLVMLSPSTLIDTIYWLQGNLWAAFLVVVAFVVGVFAKKNG